MALLLLLFGGLAACDTGTGDPAGPTADLGATPGRDVPADVSVAAPDVDEAEGPLGTDAADPLPTDATPPEDAGVPAEDVPAPPEDLAPPPPDAPPPAEDVWVEPPPPGGLCADYVTCSETCAETDMPCQYDCYFGATFACRECYDDYTMCLYGNDCVEPSGDVDLQCFYTFCYRIYDICFLGDTPPACEDEDGDGYGLSCALGLDCDDRSDEVFPGQPELCNGRDDDCDGRIDDKLSDCAVVRKWAVLLYMAADNDLVDSALQEIQELARAGGSNADVAVALQVELNGQHSYYDRLLPPEVYERTWRMVLPSSREADLRRLFARASSIGDQNVAEAASLTAFLDWAVAAVPAEHYAVILWDHGGGWTGALYDEGSFESMAMPTIREGLAASQLRPDVLAFSACLMGMIEVVAELDGLADFMVASEEVAFGLPSQDLVAALHANPQMDARAAALALHEAGVTMGESWGLSYTIATYDMAGAPALVAAVQALGGLLLENLEAVRGRIEAALPTVQPMAFQAERDLVDFVREIQGTGIAALDTQLATVEALALDPAFLVRSSVGAGATPDPWNPSLADAHGLSVHLPRPVDAYEGELETYRALAFAAGEANWDEFVEAWLGDAPLGVAPGDFRVELTWSIDGLPAPEVDVDLFLYTPNGYAVPYRPEDLTTGAVSEDSLVSGVAEEWFQADPETPAGSYFVFAVLQDTGVRGPEVEATLRFTDAHWADNDQVYTRTLSLDAPCTTNETLLSEEVTTDACTSVWFVGKLVRDDAQHTLLPGIYSDFALHPSLRPRLPVVVLPALP